MNFGGAVTVRSAVALRSPKWAVTRWSPVEAGVQMAPVQEPSGSIVKVDLEVTSATTLPDGS